MEGVLSSSGRWKQRLTVCDLWNVCCVSLFALVESTDCFSLRLVEIITEMLQVMLDSSWWLAARLDVRCLGGLSSEVCFNSVTPDSECGLGPKRGWVYGWGSISPHKWYHGPSVETVVYFHGLSMNRKYWMCSHLWVLCCFCAERGDS